MTSRVLLTGFGPYGSGEGINPASQIVERLSGSDINGAEVIGRILPVSLRQLSDQVAEILDTCDPSVIISLGLFPGEPMIRLERMAVNVADFGIPDNDGTLVQDVAVRSGELHGRFATLPVRAIEKALLEEGIPAQVSYTAGTFLCNATLYSFLSALEAGGRTVPCGFIHLPYLPAQVAELIRSTRREQKLEAYQRADLASMDLGTMIRAVQRAAEIALGTDLGHLA